MAAAKREQMLKWVRDDLVSIRHEKCALLVHNRANHLSGYLNCMRHHDELTRAERELLHALIENAEMYALRECLY